MRYRKKPVVIEASQWHQMGDHPQVVPYAGNPRFADIDQDRGRPSIRTLEGDIHWVTPGDWIIKGVEGEFYACNQDIFAKTYEPESARPEALRSGETTRDRLVRDLVETKAPVPVETPRTDALMDPTSPVGFKGQAMVDLARQLERELAAANARLEWLYHELKVTIAYALGWPTIPQDLISFRAKLDEEETTRSPLLRSQEKT